MLAELQGDTELDNVVQLVFSYLQLQHPGLVLQPTYRYTVQYSTVQYSTVLASTLHNVGLLQSAE